MTVPVTSAFWYAGRLEPALDAQQFDVQEAPIDGASCRLEVLRNGLAVWSRSGSTTIRSPADAARFIDVLLGAYALIGGTVLDFVPTGWVEATEAEFAGTVVGFTLGSARSHVPTTRRSRASVDMRRAATVARRVWATPWGIALRDLRVGMQFVHLAGSQVTPAVDDSFVFAYRVIEDCRAAAAGAVNLKPDQWLPLNDLLGTDEEALKARTRALFKARNACAHADPPIRICWLLAPNSSASSASREMS